MAKNSKLQGGLDDYKVGSKNNWRRRVWNQASVRLSRIGIAPKDARVLYLSAAQDIDRKVAVGKGFSSHNLFAVDIEGKAIDKVRKNGGVGLCGNLAEIVKEWPSGKPIHFIHADFCAGLVTDAFAFINAMQLKNSPCIISVNMQRGRERDGKALRSWVDGLNLKNVDSKHRGFQLIYVVTHFRTLDNMVSIGLLSEKDVSEISVPWVGGLGFKHAYAYIKIFGRVIQEFLRPTLMTYKASRVTMDSVVFDHPFTYEKDCVIADNDPVLIPESRFNVKGRISAALAISTQMKNGTLKTRAI